MIRKNTPLSDTKKARRRLHADVSPEFTGLQVNSFSLGAHSLLHQGESTSQKPSEASLCSPFHRHTEVSAKKIKGLQDNSLSLGVHLMLQQGGSMTHWPSVACLHSTFDAEQLRMMNAEMLENVLRQHQTLNELLQTKLEAALEDNRQLKLVIADEQQLAMDRYQALRRMIVEHLEHCPVREEKSETLERHFVSQPSSENGDPFARSHSPSAESVYSFGFPESTFETEHPDPEHDHVEQFVGMSSEERKTTEDPEDLPTASQLQLSLSGYNGEAHELYDEYNG
jgi:hypothetical protein